MSFFNGFQVLLALYLLFQALRGKGRIFQNDYLKIPREKYVKIMRLLCLFTGIFMLSAAVLELSGLMKTGTPLSWILWGLTMLGCFSFILFNVRSTDREKANAAAQGRAVPTKENPDPLRAAFVFDDEDELNP